MCSCDSRSGCHPQIRTKVYIRIRFTSTQRLRPARSRAMISIVLVSAKQACIPASTAHTVVPLPAKNGGATVPQNRPSSSA